MKSCTGCKSVKPLSSFYANKRVKDGRMAKCKECWKEKGKKYHQKNREKMNARTRAYYQAHLEQSRLWSRRNNVKRYGVSEEEYDALFKRGAGQCWICHGDPDTGKQLSIDHDHTTGVIRGLLCRTCNFGVGSFRDNPALCESGASYLRRGCTDQREA